MPIARTLILALVLSGWASFACAEKRVALVIGNSAYEQISPLGNPKNDAELVAASLRAVGFEVTVATDVDVRAMSRAVRDFGRSLRSAGSDGVGLFYYAGHGIQASGANYLLPVDARIEDEADLRLDAVSASDVLAQMESAGNALNLVVLDACRNNPFQSRFRSAVRGLARIEAPSGSLVAYAAAPGQVAADGDGANGPYATALARAIRQPGLELTKVFRRVRLEVEQATGRSQTPWEESSLRGDFFFAGRAGASGGPPALPPAVAAAPDTVASDYAAAERIGTIAAWKAFLAQHGHDADRFHVQLAQAALGKLARADDAGAETAAISREEALAFVGLVHSREAAGDLANFVRRHFAPTVDYYGKPMSRGQVLADKTKWFARWADWRLDVDEASLSLTERGDGTYELVHILDYLWIGRSRSKVLEGRALVTRKIRKQDGRLVIESENSILIK